MKFLENRIELKFTMEFFLMVTGNGSFAIIWHFCNRTHDYWTHENNRISEMIITFVETTSFFKWKIFSDTFPNAEIGVLGQQMK